MSGERWMHVRDRHTGDAVCDGRERGEPMLTLEGFIAWHGAYVRAGEDVARVTGARPCAACESFAGVTR